MSLEIIVLIYKTLDFVKEVSLLLKSGGFLGRSRPYQVHGSYDLGPPPRAHILMNGAQGFRLPNPHLDLATPDN